MAESTYFGVVPSNTKDVENRYRYITTAGQTTFAANYAVGYVDVFYGGVKLDPATAFTAADGTTVVLTNPASTGVVVEIISKRQVLLTAAPNASFLNVTSFTATAGQTTFSVSYTVGGVMMVTCNGIDVPFTAATGTTVVLSTACLVGDKVKVYVSSLFSVANAVAKTGDTMTGALALNAGGTTTTAAPGDSSTNIASTAFVSNALSNVKASGATGGGKDTIFVENDPFMTTSYTIGQGSQAACTISIASPAVVTQANTYVGGETVFFMTTGALPTGLTALTPYYVLTSGLSSSAFSVSATRGGAAVNTSGTQSGSQTCGKAKSAVVTGPLVIATGATLTIPTGQRLVIL